MILLTDDEIIDLQTDAMREYTETHPREWTYPQEIPGRSVARAQISKIVEWLRENWDMSPKDLADEIEGELKDG